MVTQWDWTTHTTYEFRTNRICARFRDEFVKELFDFTMADAIDVLEKRGREIDMVHGADPRRTKRLATITGVFRRGDKAGAGCLSELWTRSRLVSGPARSSSGPASRSMT